ncbi:MAG: ATPase, T2SS/T4P/T4SS family [Myxococcales bacterium]|nr:ATPase, T2SS/T4P/T4SS family [Myxococcales bacterium]
MYAVVITDEGGVRRRLDFAKPELTVGRVQGNDIVLAKRNVSKQHARLTLQDEQAVVVDLNSTNGTWVNGRKITTAQPLKQGDKIYIADFIITLEAADERSQTEGAMPRVSEPPPLPAKSALPAASSSPIRRSIAARRATPGGSSVTGLQPDGSGTVSPPRLQRRETSLPRARAKTETEISVGDPLNNLLHRLSERVDIDDINPASMKNQERWSAARAAIAETFLAMQKDGLVHADLDMRGLAHAALHEAVGLGALDDLLSDESVRTIVVNGHKKIFVDKGEGLEATALQFSSARAVQRVARRLAAECGQTLEGRPVLNGRLSFGPSLTILQPPLVMSGSVIELRIHSPSSLEQLSDKGWLSADAATYLTKAVAECRNIVVAGARGSGVTKLMSALVRELPESENTVAIETIPELDIDRDRLISLTAADSGIPLSQAIAHGARLHAEHLVINDLSGAETMAALTAVLGREPGHLLGVHCWSSKDAIEGLMLAAGATGADRAYLAQLLASAVDLVVSMQRGPEGQRVNAILEVQGHEGGDVTYQSVPF